MIDGEETVHEGVAVTWAVPEQRKIMWEIRRGKLRVEAVIFILREFTDIVLHTWMVLFGSTYY